MCRFSTSFFVAQENQDHADHQHDGQDQREIDLVDGVANELRTVDQDAERAQRHAAAAGHPAFENRYRNAEPNGQRLLSDQADGLAQKDLHSTGCAGDAGHDASDATKAPPAPNPPNG